MRLIDVILPLSMLFSSIQANRGPNLASSNVKKEIIVDKSDRENPLKKRQEREQLFEAYNLLHSLAQVPLFSASFLAYFSNYMYIFNRTFTSLSIHLL